MAAGLLAAATPSLADSFHLYSYDPADTVTREAAGPLTFAFRRGLLHTTLINLRSTEAEASAPLKPAGAGVAPGWERTLAQAGTTSRDLYEVESTDEGAALISAFCPGDHRAWMAFGPMKLNADLRIDVLGQASTDRPARLCRTLRFTFHGEWRLPPGRSIDPRDLEHPRFPGG